MKQILTILVLLCIFDLSFTTAIASEIVRNNYGDYIAGFILDEKSKTGIENATIVITDSRNKLYSLRSGQGGWFETLNPLSKATTERKLNLTVLKRGYITTEIKIVRQNAVQGHNLHEFKQDIFLKKHENYYIDKEYSYSYSNVMYGFVYNKLTNKPIQGASVRIVDGIGEESRSIGSTVSRDSGFFALYYENKNETLNKELHYAIEHRDFTKTPGRITLTGKNDYLEKAMPQEMRYYSLGLGYNFQTTGTQSDKESGGAITVGVTWYPDGLLILDEEENRFRNKPGLSGYEIFVGTIPYVVDRQGRDDIDFIYVYGIGVVFDIAEVYALPIQFRAGLAGTDTGKSSVYFGLNFPLYLF